MPAIAIAPRFAHSLLVQAEPVRLLFLDVDGVLTDGGLYYGPEGEQLKRFHTLDGHGIKLLAQAGIEVAVITGRDSAALRLRLQALGVRHAVYGTEHKLPAAEQLLHSLGLGWAQAAAMGDDWPDLPVLGRCALACAPPGAHEEAKALAHYITQAPGGQGAVRELCDLLLMAGGHYGALLQQAMGKPA
ncbi:3-deoxy-D-manno-octulosonate 8-phosphate phosphatase [Vandammella animalimorsus]|uniref:3-deoxy-D-manno-octulosonate 8-phosphate phosphatase KdsC n=1 Tax=Vandammella animalimorsus TaxID=2029117 RepID=A0A2A2ANI2_9BURK|nr:3-deoxy-D-manno-octulosonate 8-phosphate phosphatase [Vandammella animalimorsus]PAT39272.1 3-deoxy-D-manno-octulosonate 8-phosphate phosphatase [Vandammella animalimorsus]